MAYHRVLERQIKKALGKDPQIPAEWQALLELVSASYEHSEQDRKMLERSIDLSSKEMMQYNADLRQHQKEVEEMLTELKNTQLELVASQRLAEMSYELQTKNEQLMHQQEELTVAYENLRQAQQHLVQAEKMSSLGQLTAGIAHEINNPVNFIYVGIQALEGTLKEAFTFCDTMLEAKNRLASGQIRKGSKLLSSINRQDVKDVQNEMLSMMNSIKVGAERTSAIVRGLKHFSHSNTDETQYANLKELLDSTIIILNNRLKDRIVLHRQFSEMPPITCYPGQLNQVFLNVLSNAIDAIEDRGEIWVKLFHQNKEAHICIKDSGAGMPLHIRKRIFDPFFTTKEIGKGTGLGLSISYGIIQKHSGSIEVESEPGQGTTFQIRLPLHQ